MDDNPEYAQEYEDPVQEANQWSHERLVILANG